MRHGDGQQIGSDPLPVVDGFIVRISPMEIEVPVELAFRARIGEIQGFCGFHGNKNLNQRIDARENTFVSILFDLICSLSDGYAALFQLNMDHRHTIDQKHQVTAAVLQHLRFTCENGLLCDLITALSGGDLLTVIDFQRHFLAEMERISGIVARQGDGLTVDKAV